MHLLPAGYEIPWAPGNMYNEVISRSIKAISFVWSCYLSIQCFRSSEATLFVFIAGANLLADTCKYLEKSRGPFGCLSSVSLLRLS
jgi:hypothetical protein